MMRLLMRPGAVLLEVLVALTILVTAGAGVLALVGETSRAVSRARDADQATREASAFLDAVALWPREDLDRRLGTRSQGPWRLSIDRVAPTLYLVSLADSGTGGRHLLRTSLYRPEPPRASQ